MISWLTGTREKAPAVQETGDRCKKTGGVCKCPKKNGISGNGTSSIQKADSGKESKKG